MHGNGAEQADKNELENHLGKVVRKPKERLLIDPTYTD